jgi:hypothetical protein
MQDNEIEKKNHKKLRKKIRSPKKALGKKNTIVK